MKEYTVARRCSTWLEALSTCWRFDADASRTQIIAICAGASLVSLLFTGFVFGIDNNLFHLPILHRLYDEDQFRSDAFMQSLRYYSSGIWLLLAGTDKYFGDGHLLFLGLLFFSRLLSFIGFVACASLTGIHTVREQVIFSLILCFIAILDGYSLAGYGGLFVSEFSHSEVANGTILLAIYFAVSARIAMAVVFAGLTFFINPFMGAWLALPLIGIFASLFRRQRIGGRQLLAQLTIGGIGYAILATPVVSNILSNSDFGRRAGFHYSEYLRNYFGAHFFVNSSPAYEVLMLFALAALGWLTLSRLKDSEPALKAALTGMVALYVVGMFVPAFTSSPTILNMHLLRSGVMIHLLVAMSASALATKWLTSANGRESTFFGPFFLFFLCIKHLFPAAAVFVALKESIQNRAKEPRDLTLRAVIFIALCVVVPWRAWQHFSLTSTTTISVSEWETIGGWAKSSTEPGSTFLISMTRDTTAQTPADKRHADALAVSSVVFEAVSHRRIWVDFKRGAAVMWRPSYYRVWKPRVNAILELKSISETLNFARKNAIDYVIGDCQVFGTARIEPVFRTASLCVSAASESRSRPPPQGNVELMTEKQILDFEPTSRFEHFGDEHFEPMQDHNHRSE